MANSAYTQPTPSDPWTFMERSWLRHVVTIPDADLRAHSIALTYSKLGSVLDDLICGRTQGEKRDVGKTPETSNANWFHFATWGTVTITANIANQRPPQRIDMLPLLSLRRRLTPLVIQLRASSGQRVSQALAWGQRLMFVSVGLTLAHLADSLDQKPSIAPAQFSLDGLDSRPDAVADEIIKLGTWHGRKWIMPKRHLRVVSEAFRLYLYARQTPHPTKRAQYILGANVLLTSIEQDLVNPAIEAVVNHIPQTMAAAFDQRLARWVERWTSVPSQVTSLQLPFRYTGARQFLDTAWSRLMTDQVFVIALPTETLRLGRDIPPLHPGRPYFPKALRSIRTPTSSPRSHEGGTETDDLAEAAIDTATTDTEPTEVAVTEGATAAAPHDTSATTTAATTPAPKDPMTAALEDVAELIESLDRTSGNGHGSAARDWRRWDERMNFAVTLMRSRQQDDTLFWSPYSGEDQQHIVTGEMPHRTGDPSVLEVQAPLSNESFLAALEAMDTIGGDL